MSDVLPIPNLEPEHEGSLLRRFAFALKPASWPKVLVPMAFGQVLAFLDLGSLDARALVYVLAFTLFDIAFIVLWNDYGDRRIDAIKRRMFPHGCSKKTIPDGILSARFVFVSGLAAGALAMGVSFAAALHLGRPHAPIMAAACLLLFVSYTMPPLRLNYRGGGELLEALGIGVALPLFAAYVQSGRLVPGAWTFLPGYALLSFASAVASGLSDEESDRIGGKRTVASVFGNRAARWVVEGSLLVGSLLFLTALVLPGSPAPAWLGLPFVAVVAFAYRRMRKIGHLAITNAFREQGEYKAALHIALWKGPLLFGAALAAYRLFGT